MFSLVQRALAEGRPCDPLKLCGPPSATDFLSKHSKLNLTYRHVPWDAHRDTRIFAVSGNARLSEYPCYSPPVCDTLKRYTTMDDAKLRIASSALRPVEKISTHSVSFAAALARKDLSPRHSAITADLYSYLRYKMWTAKIRDAFKEAK